MAGQEASIQRSIQRFLKKNGVEVFKTHGGIYSNSGMSDLIGILPDGRFLAIEVKSEAKKEPTELQYKFMKQVRENNGLAFWAWSVDCVRDELISAGYDIL